MIRCKLISPTNLLLEHPLLLAPHDEAEFYVLSKTGLKNQRREWVYYGAVLGFAAAGMLVPLFGYIARFVR